MRRSATALLTVAALAAPGCRVSPPPPELTAGSEVAAELRPGETHLYRVELKAAEAFETRVDQHGVDLTVAVLDPGGDPVVEVDSPLGGEGTEHTCFVAAAGGEHRLRIRPLAGSTGGAYTLRLGEIRPATESDRRCLEASRLFAAAEAARYAGGAIRELLPRYERAERFWVAAGHPFEAAIARRERGVLWGELGDPDAELRCLLAARPLFERAGDARQEVVLLNLLGHRLANAGRLTEAEAVLTEARERAGRAGDRPGEAAALNNLALVARYRGEVHRALDDYRRALDLWEVSGDPRQAATTLLNLGAGYTLLGRYDDALDQLDRARRLAVAAGDSRLEAHVLNAVGWALYQSARSAGTRQVTAAIDRYLEAIEISRAVGAPDVEGEAQDRLGTAYRALDRLPEALSAHRAALAIAEATGDRRGIAHSRANLGWLLEALGRSDEARLELAAACELFRRLDDPDGLAYALAGLASLERRSGNLPAARDLLEQVMTQVQRMRRAARRSGALESPHVLDARYTELYVDLLVELSEADLAGDERALAFEVSDLARAENLYALLLESALRSGEALNTDLVARRDDVELRLEQAPGDGNGAAGGRPLERPPAALRALLREYDEIEAEIRRSLPGFSEIIDPAPLPLADAQALLDPDTVILSYLLGEERSLLFVVGPDTFASYALPGQEEIEALATAAYEALRYSRHRRTRRQSALATAALSEAVLWPALAGLEAHRLLVIGDGVLHYIPFAALPLPATAGDGRAGRLVIDSYEVVYVPSASVLATLRRREATRDPAPGGLAVLADPVVSGLPGTEPAHADAHTRLPHAHREAESIAALLPADQVLLLLDRAATEEQATSGVLAGYRILHFATHAVIDERHPELSGIALSPSSSAARPGDGYLRLHELFTLDLPADLVVLSACRTALGEPVRGDGLIGLTRGFFFAGASRLIVSLWEVPDAATAELMRELYRGILTDRLAPALALRRAQQRVRRNPRWERPYYWAGFVLQGDWR
jgi:CHAT domain-containing protein